MIGSGCQHYLDLSGMVCGAPAIIEINIEGLEGNLWTPLCHTHAGEPSYSQFSKREIPTPIKKKWSSGQANTYGNLELVKRESGEYFLEMGDCFGDACTGPLSKEQVEAFFVLFKISEKDCDKNPN